MTNKNQNAEIENLNTQTTTLTEAVSDLLAALRMYMEVGDQCSRGYLARCEDVARKAIAKAEAA